MAGSRDEDPDGDEPSGDGEPGDGDASGVGEVSGGDPSADADDDTFLIFCTNQTPDDIISYVAPIDGLGAERAVEPEAALEISSFIGLLSKVAIWNPAAMTIDGEIPLDGLAAPEGLTPRITSITATMTTFST